MRSRYLLLLVPFVLAGCNLFGGGVSNSSGDGGVVPVDTATGEAGETVVESDQETSEEGVVEVSLEAKNFTFGREEIRVKKGETVRVMVNNVQGTHDFVIDEFEVNSGIIPTGSAETVEFVAEETGSFEYYCSVGNHRQLGMKGILVVE